MQQSPTPSGAGEFYFIVERQHGSSEEAWTKVRCEEGRWEKK